jgi:hypothetical protein
MDEVLLKRDVLIVGDYFTMIVSPVLHDHLRRPDEGDEDMAVRLACEFMLAHYGWDLRAVANHIGVMDE